MVHFYSSNAFLVQQLNMFTSGQIVQGIVVVDLLPSMYDARLGTQF